MNRRRRPPASRKVRRLLAALGVLALGASVLGAFLWQETVPHDPPPLLVEEDDGGRDGGLAGAGGSIGDHPPEPALPEPLPIRAEVRVRKEILAAEKEDGPALAGTITSQAQRAGVTVLPLAHGESLEGVSVEAVFAAASDHALPGVRMRLFDEAGRLVPAEEEITVGAGTSYGLVPREPLIPGSAYRLLIDGQEGPPTDVAQTNYLPSHFSFRTEGEKPPPPPKRRRGRR